MNLRCAPCLHTPPGDSDATKATEAVTVMSGIAVCDEHIDWLALPDEFEELR